MNENDIPVVMMDLPTAVRGFCRLGPDCGPIIVLNQKMTYEQQQKTYLHELDHIRSGEMYDPEYHEYGGPET